MTTPSADAHTSPPNRPARCRRCWHIISRDYDHPTLVKARQPGSGITVICLACGCQQFTTERPRVAVTTCTDAITAENLTS